MLKENPSEISARLSNPDDRSRGSALLAAIFVITLLTAMGVFLLFVSQTEVRMNQADHRSKQAFYLAEAGTERGREQVRLAFVASSSGDMQPLITTAAGANHTIDFNPANVRPQFSGTTLTGFTGTGDDVPIVSTTTLGGGTYTVYLTNDPAEGETNTSDANNRVMVTGLGVTSNGSFEMAQVIIRPGTIFPTPPATITLLGPNPDVDDKGGKGWMNVECPKQTDYAPKGSKVYVDGVLMGTSKIYRAYNGTDCADYRVMNGLGPDGKHPKLDNVSGTGGVPGLYFPTYGVVDNAGETKVEHDMAGSKVDYLSNLPGTRTQIVRPAVPVGGYQEDDTVANLSDATEPTVIGSGLGPLDPTWTSCTAVKAIVERLKVDADYLCVPPATCTLPSLSASSITFINGDWRVPCGYEGYGLLAVTGQLDFPGSASWHGMIFVVGEGHFYRVKQTGYGNVTGGIVVADIAGPDKIYGNADDCTGGSGGFGTAEFDEGKGKEYRGSNIYCSAQIDQANPGYKEPPIKDSFRQR